MITALAFGNNSILPNCTKVRHERHLIFILFAPASSYQANVTVRSSFTQNMVHMPSLEENVHVQNKCCTAHYFVRYSVNVLVSAILICKFVFYMTECMLQSLCQLFKVMVMIDGFSNPYFECIIIKKIHFLITTLTYCFCVCIL